jgi:hypothetical protein
MDEPVKHAPKVFNTAQEILQWDPTSADPFTGCRPVIWRAARRSKILPPVSGSVLDPRSPAQ